MSDDVDVRELADRLARVVDGRVGFDAGDRHLYATDASHYRSVPIGVVVPRHVDDVVATMSVCHELGVPVTPRGAGTSLAGQATNVTVVIDASRHLTSIGRIDPERRRATVQPGVVLDDLCDAAAPYGLTFGPDPSTHNRCTLGGMIGNNACGIRSVATGRTVDNVVSLEVLLHDGTRLTVGGEGQVRPAVGSSSARAEEVRRGLVDLRDRYDSRIRAGFPQLPRRVSGFNLDELLPERGANVARALVGTEGTCAMTLEATVTLVERPAALALTVIGFPSIAAAADRVPEVLAEDPVGLEGIDREVVEGARRRGTLPADGLPDGEGWLLAEFAGSTPAQAVARARGAARRCGGTGVRVVEDRIEQARIWAIRRSGLGATTFPPGARPRWPGWEDAAVPPERAGAYLRDFRSLLERYGLDAAIYGHFGDGCIHAKIDFDHTTHEGIADYRRFVEEAADLVVSYDGSLSGEHGDGQARGELLERMYGEELVGAFRAFKAIWDPDGLMNPGKVVDPRPLDADLRLGPDHRPRDPSTIFGYPDDGGSFARAAGRCVGVGTCRRDDGSGTMCPSYMVTHEEQHSTRGRARLLFEMLQPDSQLDGWADRHVHEALELCLSCKGCKVDCPVGVDMATYKAEFMSHHYDGRRRPVVHHALGLIRRWARLAALAPGTANLLLGPHRLAATLKRAVGVAPERPTPRFATQTFRRWWAGRPTVSDDGPEVVLFVDTFTDHFEPEIGRAAVAVLEDAGFRVRIPSEHVCCGRPLYDHGMLERARRHLEQLVRVLGDEPEDAPVVVLEPSCVATFRDELVAMLPDDAGAQRLRRRVRTLAEFLVAVGYEPPRLERRALVHGHCQQKATAGLRAEAEILDAMGLAWTELDAGCCGLAGSFGFEAGDKFEVSVAAGERKLMPAVRAADDDTLLLADGFSCRTQVDHLQRLAGSADEPRRRPLHLAQLLRLAAETGASGPVARGPVERSLDEPAPARFARHERVAAVVLLAAATAWAVGRSLSAWG